MHLLVVVAEGVRDAQFGNIHQSTFSIPGVAKMRRKQLEKGWRKSSVPMCPHILKKCCSWSSWVLSLLPPLFQQNQVCLGPTNSSLHRCSEYRQKQEWRSERRADKELVKR